MQAIEPHLVVFFLLSILMFIKAESLDQLNSSFACSASSSYLRRPPPLQEQQQRMEQCNSKDSGRLVHRKLQRPVLIAHRGDKAIEAENTIPAFESAISERIDYVETDLVLTADGVLVCFHDIHLKRWTDIEERSEFAHKIRRNLTVYLEGHYETIQDDWLISDLTLNEVRKLKVKQEKIGTSWSLASNGGEFGIPTFHDFLELVHNHTLWRRGNRDEGFVVGIMVEIKYPSFHNAIFQEENFIEKQFLKELESSGYFNGTCRGELEVPCSHLVIQSWEVETINFLRRVTDLDLLTVLDTYNLKYLTRKGMAELQGKTKYIALWKDLVGIGTEAQLQNQSLEWDKDLIESLGGFVEPLEMVDFIHGMGIKVAIYTVYEESQEYYGNNSKEKELRYYFELGVDAIFVEGIRESMKIREKYYCDYEQSNSYYLPKELLDFRS